MPESLILVNDLDKHQPTRMIVTRTTSIKRKKED